MAPLEGTPSDLSSMSSSGLHGEKVGLRLSFGGEWRAQKDGSSKYVGGETYLEKVPSTLRYAELMHRLSEKVNKGVILKYTPPGEDVDPNNLVTCVDDDHVQEMFEEYTKAAKANDTPGKTFRLQVWLFEAKEEELTPEDIGKARTLRRNSSMTSGTPMHMEEDSTSSNGSNVSDGTRSPHMQGRRLAYNPSTASKLLNDVEMQEKEAEETVNYMHEIENGDLVGEDDLVMDPPPLKHWTIHIGDCLSRAHGRTFDSNGWPYDRTPIYNEFTNQRCANLQKVSQAPDKGKDRPCQNLNLQFQQISPDPQNKHVQELKLADNVDPMQADTPDVAASAPRVWTQDSYKDDEAEPEVAPPAEEESSSQPDSDATTRKAYTHRSIHLPSDLGFEIGHALNGKALGSEVAEKAHAENVALGVAEYALQSQLMDWQAPETVFKQPTCAGFGAGEAEQQRRPSGIDANLNSSPWGLFRVPSRLVDVTQDSVFRVAKQDISIIDKIGEGTFGEVHLAYNNVFGRIAVKWLKASKADKHKDKFWEEAKLLAALNHPNVLRFYGCVTEVQSDLTMVGIITEYMGGSSLSHYLRADSPPISLARRAELAKGAVNGLAYLHKMNIVHFDLKPDNLLLDTPLAEHMYTPNVKVADFGLSKHKLTKFVSGVRDLRGTLPYMAPELVSDPDHVTEAADIWSLGMVLWEMVTHETPFQLLEAGQIVTGLMNGHLWPEIPRHCEPEWCAILNGCLQVNPEDRIGLSEIGAMLDDIIRSSYPPYPPPLY